MTQTKITYKKQNASKYDIAKHLLICDEHFTPRLSKRVDIPTYSIKLSTQAHTFEAWSELQLIGLVATYFDNKTGFITNVSTLPQYSKKGVATNLMRNCISEADSQELECLVLEVNQENNKAVQLYRRLGFILQQSNKQIMTLKLKPGK